MVQSEIYRQLRNWFATANATMNAAAATPLPEGSLAVRGLSALRETLGGLLQTRLWADVFITLFLFAMALWLLWSIASGCRQLGCAFLKLAFFGVSFAAAVFWLLTIVKLSDNEFHESYVQYIAWAWDSMTNGRTTPTNR